MTPDSLPWFYGLLFVVGFALFWYVICHLIGRVGGWHTLARSYTTTQTPSGSMFHLGQFELNASQYKGAVVVRVAEEGLYLYPIFLFRPGHPTLLIPWNAFQSLRVEKMLWMTGYVTDIVTPNGDTVTATFYDSKLAQIMTEGIARPPRIAR